MQNKEFYELWHKKNEKYEIDKIKQNNRISVIKKLLPQNFNKILFIGCGKGDELRISKPGVALDISFTAVKMAKEKNPEFKFIVADAYKLPFKENSFDLIICSEILEHIKNPDKVIPEIRRILKGTFIATVPNWFSFYGLFRRLAEIVLRKEVTAADQPIDNWFTPKSFKNLLQPHFSIISSHGCWYFPPTGKGKKQISSKLIKPIFKILNPLDKILGRLLPPFGHMLILKAKSTNYKLITPTWNKKINHYN